MSNTPAACQCVKCFKYVARDRQPGGPQFCVECDETFGLPLAQLRKALQDPLSVELLGLMTEECGEVSQRIGKIMRWGWEADFEGTTQRHKLETELGDVLATIALAIHNGLVTRDGVHDAVTNKILKLIEDAQGPRQRLQVANVPMNVVVHVGAAEPGETMNVHGFIEALQGLSNLWITDETEKGN